MKIAVSIGHYPEKQWHRYDNKSEYSECAVIAGFCIQDLTGKGYKVFPVPADTLFEKVKWINKGKFNFAVEFHLNDFHSLAKGCEVFYSDKVDSKINDKQFANDLSKYLSLSLGNRNRGGKLNNSFYFLRETKCSALLVEPFFMRYEYCLMNDTSYKVIAESIGKII